MPTATGISIPAASFADVATTACAITFAALGCLLRWCSGSSQRWHSIVNIFNDLMRGTSFFPFLLVTVSILYPRALAILIETNRAVLALAGLIAAMYVLHDFFRSAWRKPRRRKKAGSPAPAGADI